MMSTSTGSGQTGPFGSRGGWLAALPGNGARSGGRRHHAIVLVIARRLAMAVPLVLIVTSISFVLLSLTPGNAALRLLGDQATPARVAAVRRSLGLNLSLPQQYWHWLSQALHGNLGTSYYGGPTVASSIGQRLPVSLSLMLCSLLVMLVIGVGLGILSAVRGGAVGRFVDGLSLVGYAVPTFWISAVLISLLAVDVHAFPAVGYVSLGVSPGQWLRSITLPVLALSLGGVALVAKQTREAMLDVLVTEHIRMARANGIPRWSIVLVYALKNVGPRVLTMMGLLTVGLLSGTTFVETIFSLPGLGSYLVTGAYNQDIPVVQGVTLVFTLLIVCVNLITDIGYTLLDPRLKAT
jgi:peptide/nickel transport system permease protein